MPLYEYQCESCAHRFERIQKFSDPPIETCPVCGGRVSKLLSSPAIQFKGSGWYITDYAKKPAAGSGDTKPAGAAKESPDAGSTSAETTTKETKDSSASTPSKPAASKSE